jgi:hypothetical protein
VTQIVKLKDGLISGAQNSNARDVRWSEIPGCDCTDRCGSYVGEPTLVLKNAAEFACVPTEDKANAIAGWKTARRIFPEAGGDFYREGIVRLQVAKLDMAVSGRLVEQQLTHRRRDGFATRVCIKRGFDGGDDVDRRECRHDLRAIVDGRH